MVNLRRSKIKDHPYTHYTHDGAGKEGSIREDIKQLRSQGSYRASTLRGVAISRGPLLACLVF